MAKWHLSFPSHGALPELLAPSPTLKIPRAIETGLQLTFSFDQTSWFSNLTLGWENYFWKEAVVNNFNWLSRESAVKAVCNHSWQFYREDDGLDIELKIAFSAVQLTKLITFLSGLSPGQFSNTARCLKITGKVSLNIASETSTVYISVDKSWQKCQKLVILAFSLQVLPDRPFYCDKNWWKRPQFKCDILSNFQTMCRSP